MTAKRSPLNAEDAYSVISTEHYGIFRKRVSG